MGIVDARELEALDWAAELDRRAWESALPEWVRDCNANGDIGTLVQRFGGHADTLEAHDVRAAEQRGRGSALAGLVQTPTSQTRSRRPTVPARLRAESQAIAEAIGAFASDPDARRLAMLRMSVGVSARWHVAQAPGQCLMVTLTYRTADQWEPGHIRSFMDTVRHWYRRRGIECRYVWVAELQKRGAMHYHVALWLPEGELLPKPDEAGWWAHGWTRIEWARGAVGYLMKYLSKGSDVQSFPRGARTFGAGGLGAVGRGIRRWCRYPAFVRALADVTQRWTRAPGGGWCDPDGVIWRSEFARVRVGVEWMLQRVHDHGLRPWATGPYSSLDGRVSWASSTA